MSQFVWKFLTFSITQILREINFGDSKSAKFAILTDLESLNFDLLGIFALFEGRNYQINKIQSDRKIPKYTHCVQWSKSKQFHFLFGL